MMSLLKFFFWLITAVILAYFLTDIKVGGITLKGHIDRILFDGNQLTFQEKIDQLASKIGNKEQGNSGSSQKSELSQLIKEQLQSEEISEQDLKKIRDLIKEHQ